MKGNEQDPEFEQIIQQGVTHAVEMAKENGVTLDFSDDSINQVENLLAEFHLEYLKEQTEEGLHGVAMMLGAYIGEVIRKKGYGGIWARNDPQMGEDSFPFYWRDQTLFLYGWCMKRIFDGEADNVAYKFKVFVLDKLKDS
jgi:hypothetical protein